MLEKNQEFTVTSENESKELAHKIALGVKPGDVIAFIGDLGAGKSFFCRQIIKFLCGEDTKIISPTFNLLQTYDYDDCTIYHYDLYRLENVSEIYELGIEEALSNNIILIEWPELVEHLLPDDFLCINIKIIDDARRIISFK